LTLLVLSLGVPLLHMFGTLGMGLAWLIAQMAIALVLGAVAWRSTGWSHATLHALVGKSALGEHSALRRRIRRFLLGRATVNLVRDATCHIVDHGEARSWRCQRILRASRQFCVLALGPHPEKTTALMRIANSSEGIAALRRQSEVLRAFRTDPGLQDFCRLLPIVLAEGHAAGSAYVVERPAVGEPGYVMLGDDSRRERALASAAAAIAELHGRTASNCSIDDAWLMDWIDRPIEIVLGAAAVSSDRAAVAFEAIRRSQRLAWTGRNLPLGWSHGNFSLSNVRFIDGGACVTSIAGWNRARRNAPAVLDLCHLALTTRMSISRKTIGDVVCDLLRLPNWNVDEQRCFAGQSAALTESDTRTLVLLTWLVHVAENYDGSDRYVGNCLRTASKIDRILCSIKAGP